MCIRWEVNVRMYGVSMRMCYVRVAHVWRMQRTRDVSSTYMLRSIFICGVSVAYPWCINKEEFGTVLFTSSL